MFQGSAYEEFITDEAKSEQYLGLSLQEGAEVIKLLINPPQYTTFNRVTKTFATHGSFHVDPRQKLHPVDCVFICILKLRTYFDHAVIFDLLQLQNRVEIAEARLQDPKTTKTIKAGIITRYICYGMYFIENSAETVFIKLLRGKVQDQMPFEGHDQVPHLNQAVLALDSKLQEIEKPTGDFDIGKPCYSYKHRGQWFKDQCFCNAQIFSLTKTILIQRQS
ncbi:Hypothetical_protein [Hexamita inflata]|uniref:Hypothetical_protein n=1 Tax=Hexamita inflata TaxID=28002 RepID=A0AA86RTY1_9EUKA|nr:Hypothetical protein HINF_LOCUS65499 [Hexamita inflata]